MSSQQDGKARVKSISVTPRAIGVNWCIELMAGWPLQTAKTTEPKNDLLLWFRLRGGREA